MACGWAFFLLPAFQCSWELMIWFLQSMIFAPTFVSASKESLYKEGTGEEGGIPPAGFWVGKQDLSRHRAIIRAVVIWAPNMALSSRKEIFLMWAMIQHIYNSSLLVFSYIHINYLYGNWKNYLSVGFNLFDIKRALWGLNFFLILLLQPFSLLPAKPLGTPLVAQTVKRLPTIPVLGRSPGERNGNPLQYSCLEIPMDGGTW